MAFPSRQDVNNDNQYGGQIESITKPEYGSIKSSVLDYSKVNLVPGTEENQNIKEFSVKVVGTSSITTQLTSGRANEDGMQEDTNKLVKLVQEVEHSIKISQKKSVDDFLFQKELGVTFEQLKRGYTPVDLQEDHDQEEQQSRASCLYAKKKVEIFFHNKEMVMVILGQTSNEKTYFEIRNMDGTSKECHLLSNKGQVPSIQMIQQIGQFVYFLKLQVMDKKEMDIQLLRFDIISKEPSIVVNIEGQKMSNRKSSIKLEYSQQKTFLNTDEKYHINRLQKYTFVQERNQEEIDINDRYVVFRDLKNMIVRKVGALNENIALLRLQNRPFYMVCSKHKNEDGLDLISISSVDKNYEIQERLVIKIDGLKKATMVNQEEHDDWNEILQTEIDEHINSFGDNLKYSEIIRNQNEVKTETFKFLKQNKMTSSRYFLRKFLCFKYEDELSQEDQLLITYVQETNQMILVASQYRKNDQIVICKYNREHEENESELEEIKKLQIDIEFGKKNDNYKNSFLKIIFYKHEEQQKNDESDGMAKKFDLLPELDEQENDREKLIYQKLFFRRYGTDSQEAWAISSGLKTTEEHKSFSIQIIITLNTFVKYVQEFKLFFNLDNAWAKEALFIGSKLLFFKTHQYLGYSKFTSNLKDGKINGTQIRDTYNNNLIVLNNLDQQDYLFRDKNINSTYTYYGKKDVVQMLRVDVKLCDCIVNQINDLQYQRITFCIIQQLFQVILNMKPKRSDKQFWTGLFSFLEVDIYQPRESLNGYSIASVLVMEPKEFDYMSQLNVSDDQKTLLEEFLSLGGTKKEDILKGFENIFRDDFLLRNKKDVQLEIDLKSPGQHCLFQDKKKKNQSSRVASMIIQHLAKKSTPLNDLSVQLLVPDIFLHPEGKVVPETVLLIQDQVSELQTGSNFFKEVINETLHEYFNSYQYMIFEPDFLNQFNANVKLEHDHDHRNKSNHSWLDRLKRKRVPNENLHGEKECDKQKQEVLNANISIDKQVVDLIQKISEYEDYRQKAQHNKTRTFRMDKELFNVQVALNKEDKSEKKPFFSCEEELSKYEQSKLLSKIMDNFSDNVEELCNIRAMIEFKFQNKTKYYFIVQQIIYLVLCIIPFLALNSTYRQSWFCLWTCQLGQVAFFIVELIDMYKRTDTKSYFFEWNNISDYGQFLAHTAFFILKYIDINKKLSTKLEKTESEMQILNSILILSSIILCFMVTKLQHIMNIYSFFGMLNKLLEKSITQVYPFMILFLLYNCLFAMELYILQSNKGDVVGYQGLDKVQNLIGYFFIAFENGIGNITNPSVEVWLTDDASQTISNQVIIGLIYFFWFNNQVVLLIILLNFVIALISEQYTNVMDRKLIYEVQQKQELNRECDRIFSFLNQANCLKKKKQYQYDCVILINGHQANSSDPQWQSILQTLKRYIKKVNDSVMNKIKFVHDDIRDQNTTLGQDIKDQIFQFKKETNDQFNQLKHKPAIKTEIMNKLKSKLDTQKSVKKDEILREVKDDMEYIKSKLLGHQITDKMQAQFSEKENELSEKIDIVERKVDEFRKTQNELKDENKILLGFVQRIFKQMAQKEQLEDDGAELISGNWD